MRTTDTKRKPVCVVVCCVLCHFWFVAFIHLHHIYNISYVIICVFVARCISGVLVVFIFSSQLPHSFPIGELYMYMFSWIVFYVTFVWFLARVYFSLTCLGFHMEFSQSGSSGFDCSDDSAELYIINHCRTTTNQHSETDVQ